MLVLAPPAEAQTPSREGVPTLSGYMEVHLNKEQDLPAEADLHRFVLMVGHTFTDRLKYGVPGSEQEMRDLQEVTYERLFCGIQDFTSYPGAMKFASTDPGVKYFKMMVMQGVHAVHLHLEEAADEARAMIRSRAAFADPYIARAKVAVGAKG